jgi:hypothetical protein
MEIYMSAELILETTKTSLLIIEERKRKDIVIGVPHHAPAGISTIPCQEHPDADENAGFIGRYIAENLNCCSLIACNYTTDVNKFFRTDYTMQIASWNPKVVIEIHGHGAAKAKADIEISSGGSNNDKFSKELSDKLSASFASRPNLKNIKVCGEYNKIYFKASTAVTISDGRWISYHIELPPNLRKPAGNAVGKPPEIGYEFCRFLVKAIQEIYGT